MVINDSTAKFSISRCGIDVDIQFPAGAVRHGKVLEFPYGEIPNSCGADGDPLDVIVGPDDTAPLVFIVHQIFPETGRYDEDKLYIGFDSAIAAKLAYLTQYSPSHFGAISAITVNALREKLRTGDELLPQEAQPKLLRAFGSHAIADCLRRSPIARSEVLQGNTLIVKSEGFGSIPLSLHQLMLLRWKPSGAESFRDCFTGHTELGADLRKGFALAAQVDSLLDRPRKSSVLASVFGCCEQFQIQDGVVKPVPVFVVDDLVRSKLPSNELSHDIPVFRDLLSANVNVPVRCIGSALPSPTFAKALSRISTFEEDLHRSLAQHSIKNPPAGDRKVATGGAINFVYNSGPGPRAKPELSYDTVEHLKQTSGIAERTRARYKLSVEELEALNPQVPQKVFPIDTENNPYDINDEEDRKASKEIGQQVLKVGAQRYSNMNASPFRNNDSDKMSKPTEPSPDEIKTPNRVEQQ